jgi:5-methyltetrahydrofolate--homocysteine methyltransferase
VAFFDEPGKLWLMDGAMGTRLLPLGLPCVALANLTHPAQVRAVHRSYADAGAEVHLTNTFQVNSLALAAHSLDDRLEEIARAAIFHARSTRGIVLGSVGPIVTPGQQTDFADRDALRRTLDALDGVDGLLFETCSTPSALSAVEYASHRIGWLESRPLLLSIAYRWTDGGPRGWHGHAPEFFAHHAIRHGVTALGVNCGVGMGPEEVCDVLRRYREETDLPLFVRPNAGTPEDFSRMLPQWMAAGASMVGGCCGTTEEHVGAMAKVREEI